MLRSLGSLLEVAKADTSDARGKTALMIVKGRLRPDIRRCKWGKRTCNAGMGWMIWGREAWVQRLDLLYTPQHKQVKGGAC